MNNIVEKSTNIKDKISWLSIVIITVGAFFCNYKFALPGAIQSIIWIVWLVLVLLLGYATTTGKKVFVFAQESKIELQKVVWPSRQETIQTTTIVMVMVAVTGVILWLLDSVIMWAIAKITHLG